MKKIIHFEYNLPVSIFKEKNIFIAYSPALDLSTSGKNFNEVRKRFKEVVKIFFDELSDKDTLDQVLQEYGWKKTKQQWSAPTFVAHDNIPVRV